MKKMTPFVFEEMNVRTLVKEDGSIWFIAKDVAEVLGIQRVDDITTKEILDDDEKGAEIIRTLGGSKTMATISESGLYTVVSRSNKPNARRFRKWVTSEVISSIRRTGSYSVRKADKFALMRHMLDVLEAQEEEIQRHKLEIKGLQMDLYKRDGYFCVAGYLKRLGQNCDTKTAAKHGRKLTTM